MKENTLKHILEKFTIFTAIIIALGVIISNSYLQEYGLVDFKIVQAKTIATGILFLVIVLLHLLVFNFKFDLSKVEYFGDSKIIHSLITRFCGTIFLYLLVFGQYKQLETLPKILTSIGVLLTINYFLMEIIYSGANQTEKNRRISKVLMNIPKFGFKWIVPLLLIVILIVEESIRYLTFQYFLIFFLFFVFAFSKKRAYLDKIEKTENDTKQAYDSSLFYYFSSTSNNWKELIFAVIWSFAMIVVFINLFISLFYAKIPETYGGAKPSKLSLKLTNGKKINGLKIHQNETTVFILKNDTIRHIENTTIDYTIK
jgi:hypothetical protein